MDQVKQAIELLSSITGAESENESESASQPPRPAGVVSHQRCETTAGELIKLSFDKDVTAFVHICFQVVVEEPVVLVTGLWRQFALYVRGSKLAIKASLALPLDRALLLLSRRQTFTLIALQLKERVGHLS